MSVWRTAVVVLATGVLGVTGCSKTQDTAPEQRIFGSPPVISSVNVSEDLGRADCDVTSVLVSKFSTTILPDQYTLSPDPKLQAEVTYSETIVKATISDPEDTSTKSDILLVTTSYLEPNGSLPPNEISLIMLDDGSVNQFPWHQQGIYPSDCTCDFIARTCNCVSITYELTSRDQTANDHVFTRGFAFVTPGAGVPAGAGTIINDCVAGANHEAPSSGTPFNNGAPINLKIEAIDREGNITTWPTKPQVTIAPSTWACSGDPCACCLLTAVNVFSECRGLDGFIITDINNGLADLGFGLGPLCKQF